ncbi:hypothetical protein TSUD_301500 [Trifolium subterraneum]|uniref:C-JID domain-containing protein n=1 Tax=Trifolium subterraneum TaxID=3900 RepID=A0A2Z6NF31_TRISU|nr:hypothetical protein TSUD_301500 [Trifolium subterraneum]
MAFSWMTQLIQARQQSSAAFFHEIVDIVIPGSEIPIWFDNKSEGDSITTDLSPIIRDNDNYFGGFACCAVFSVAPVDPTTATDAHRPDIELCISNSKTHLRWYAIIPVILERRLIEVKSDHICLIYFPIESFFHILKWIDVTLNHLDDFKMEVRTKNGECMNLDVQNCGIVPFTMSYG